MNIIQELKKKKKIEEKKIVLESARELSDATDDNIDLFEKWSKIFPYKDNEIKTNGAESEENKLEKIKNEDNKFIKYIEDESDGKLWIVWKTF